jgi:predicted nucleic acid-binding protein
MAGQLSGYSFYDGIEVHITPPATDGWLELVTLTSEELRLMTSLPPKLHRGEGACLCMARQRGWGFLSDDRAARLQSALWEIPVTGTLGVLVLAIENGLLAVEQGNAILQEMILQARYRSPVTDLGLLLSE